jgi:hypothetical protein
MISGAKLNAGIAGFMIFVSREDDNYFYLYPAVASYFFKIFQKISLVSNN